MAKILDLLKPLCAAKAKVQRKHVEQVIGILIWYTTGASWLRPWLSTFYKLLYKPHAIPKKLSVQQFEQLRVVLGHDLSVRKPLPALDVDENWKLHSVCGSVVSSLNSQVLQALRVHQGSVSVVFFSQNHPSTRTCEESAYAAKLFVKAVSIQALIGAADAFTTEADAGLGGWWLPTGCTLAPQNTLWFQISLQHSNLPAWFCSPQSNMQCRIAALEALAQLVLLILQVQGTAAPQVQSILVQVPQLCDNAGVASLSSKMLSQKNPLSYMLQAIGYFSCKLGVILQVSHIAGVRNIWADMLSRGKVPEGFNMANRRCIDLATVLTEPWA